MRHRRMYRPQKVYEICFRAEEGLPLPPRPLINLIIESALARTQRDFKVTLTNHLWMSNHPHILVVSNSEEELSHFHKELKKRLTDSIKKLLGKSKLSLWPKRSVVAEVLDLEKAIDQIAYYYLNPAKANLVDSIDDYPGVSSWQAFLTAKPSVDAYIETKSPWIRLPSIPELSRPNPSKFEEARIIDELRKENKHQEKLKIYPFAWLKAFGITCPKEIEAIRQKIITRVKTQQAEYRLKRISNKTPIFGKDRLTRESLLAPHTPKKNGRRIFFISSLKTIRLAFLEEYYDFCALCREAYFKAKKGLKARWPKNAFVPSMPARTST